MSTVFTSTHSIDRGLLLLRLITGLVFIAHGWQKLAVYGIAGLSGTLAGLGFPFPTLNAVMLITAETIGGLLLVAGIATRYAAAVLAFTMLVAVFAVHAPHGFFLPNGYEFALTMMFASLALTQTGAGQYSVDGWRVSRRVESLKVLETT